MEECEPVPKKWHVPHEKNGIVQCDASSIALGVVLELEKDTVWLKKKNDAAHVNVVKLYAVMKGLNLTLKWGLHDIEVMTDSVTVFTSI